MSLWNSFQPFHASKIKRYASSKRVVSYRLTTLTLLPSRCSRIVRPSSFANSPGSTPSASANLFTVTRCAYLVPSSSPTIVLRGTPLCFENSSTVRERSVLILSRLPSFLSMPLLRYSAVPGDNHPVRASNPPIASPKPVGRAPRFDKCPGCYLAL
jgi:hypothetical protein